MEFHFCLMVSLLEFTLYTTTCCNIFLSPDSGSRVFTWLELGDFLTLAANEFAESDLVMCKVDSKKMQIAGNVNAWKKSSGSLERNEYVSLSAVTFAP